MAASSSLGPPRERLRFRWRILLALAVGPLAGGAFAVIYGLSPDLWPLALVLISPLGIGLAAGVGARLAIPGRRLLAWVIAVSSSCLGLLLLGWLTAGSMGLNPGALPARHVAWGGLIEVAMSVGGAWLSTHARGLSARAAEVSPPAPTPVAIARSPSPSEGRGQRSGRFDIGRTFRRWRRREERPRERVRLPNVARGATRRRRRALGVHIGRLAEERCPYCLDIVRPDDPRGVRRCEVCHTAHHADCWAQTGTCQVLHHHP
jgi:hypothetical protein